MSALFPAPVRSYTTYNDDAPSDAPANATATSHADAAPSSSAAPSRRAVPPYPLRVKAKFVPRSAADFGDGGAFPEIHLAQFPLGMGKKGRNSGGATLTSSANTLALQTRTTDNPTNSDSNALDLTYDAVVTQHHRTKTKVYTQFSDLVEKDVSSNALALPSRDDEIATANRTRDALQALVQGKIAAALPTSGVTRQKTAKESSTYIRYTPNDQNRMGGGASQQQRIIRMVDVAKDPMEPPKFQHTKAVRGPPSPPVPVLHSPPRKLTVQDQQNWKIPPMISNWKNSKGFTIALDKRLAADGRGLQQVTVNDNFASLSEALAIAERKAREEVHLRATVQKKVALKQKEQQESALRDLAAKARIERSGIAFHGDDDHRHDRQRSRDRSQRDNAFEDDDDDDPRGRHERDAIRKDRKKEREREMRLEKLGKKGKLARDDDRDVSEKIALGQLAGGGAGAGKLQGDALFDARLFNQSQGLSSGFGADDDYGVYSKPLTDRGKASVYRPTATNDGLGDADAQMSDLRDGHTKRFKADKQFRGTEQVGHGRNGPVQFSYDTKEKEEEEDDDNRGGGEERRGRKRSPPAQVQAQRRHSRSRSTSRSRSRHEQRQRSSRSIERERSRSRDRHATAASSRSSGRSRRSRSRSYDDRNDRNDRKRSRRDDAGDSDDDDPFGLDQFLTDARTSRSDEHEHRPRGHHHSSSSSSRHRR